MSSEKGPKHIYVQEDKLYYYYYHFGEHWENRNFKKINEKKKKMTTRKSKSNYATIYMLNSIYFCPKLARNYIIIPLSGIVAHLAGWNKEFGGLKYILAPWTNQMKREVHLHLGDTNFGPGKMFEGIPLFRGKGHFFWAPKPQFNLHSGDVLALKKWLV